MFGKKRFHYILTVQSINSEGRIGLHQFNNIIEWKETEYEALNHLLSLMIKQKGIAHDSFVILFWSFKRDK